VAAQPVGRERDRLSQGRVGSDGVFTFGALRCRAALGRGGVTGDKREGDGATPLGLLQLRSVLYRADRLRRPRTTLPVLPLAPHDGWCDDPADADYNRRVRLPRSGRHEELWRSDAVYDVVGVLGWNNAPIVPSRGSAIFLHVARPDYAPTEGCVALARPDLLAALEAGLTELLVDL
jgi:L,D-peptidoglycan transpeptidase YkuD (ErfK/YbiS/YcfS/YnhG family)